MNAHDHEPPQRTPFFRYKVLEDESITSRRDSRQRTCTACRDCCCLALPRCLNLARFLVSLLVSVVLTMGPLALAVTEIVTQILLYLLVLHDGDWHEITHVHYVWWTSEEDVVLFSFARCLLSLFAFSLGFGPRTHKPYLVAACLLACVGLPFVAVKAIMLRHNLVSKWGSLLLASAIFSVVQVVVAFNVYIFSRMRKRVSALAQDVENPDGLHQPLLQSSSVIKEQDLAEDTSQFIDCAGLRVHYTLTRSQGNDEKCCLVLIHGFGGGTFTWRNVVDDLARSSGMHVYAFDRPGFGLTSRPVLTQEERHSIKNPYQLPFQADLTLCLCEMWGCRDVVLAGHSDGALLALHTAAQASRHKAYTERRSMEGRARRAVSFANKTGSTSSTRPSLDDASLSYSPPYREDGLQIPRISDPPAGQEGPSSPFSKWLQLGQPKNPESLQAQLQNIGCEPQLSRRNSSDSNVEPCLPSFQLDEVAAILGPERDRFTGVSSFIDTSQEDFQRLEHSKGKVGVCGLVLVNPSFQGESKPDVAQILSSSRMGRHVLSRVLQNEIGCVRNRRAWFDSNNMTPEVLATYRKPLQLQESSQGIVEASRLQKEFPTDQVANDFQEIREVPKAVLAADADSVVPVAQLGRDLRRWEANADCNTLTQCGHFSIEEQPVQTVVQICSFLRKAGLRSADQQPMVFPPSPFQAQSHL